MCPRPRHHEQRPGGDLVVSHGEVGEVGQVVDLAGQPLDEVVPQLRETENASVRFIVRDDTRNVAEYYVVHME